MREDELLEAAFQARRHAHAPYSNFAVGAALLTETGKIFTGCNVENISLGLTICAERAAVAAAIANGEKDFVAIAVVADSEEPVLPCGGCRQVLAEFNPAIKIVASTMTHRRQEFSLTELLPRPRQGVMEAPGDV
jgi:cytidine deaminase